MTNWTQFADIYCLLQVLILLEISIFLTLTLPLSMSTQVNTYVVLVACAVFGGKFRAEVLIFNADNWGIPASDFEWVRSNVIADRASIAHAAGKPIIMEESGMKTGYVGSRSSFLGDVYQWANENNYAGTLVWQVYAW